MPPSIGQDDPRGGPMGCPARRGDPETLPAPARSLDALQPPRDRSRGARPGLDPNSPRTGQPAGPLRTGPQGPVHFFHQRFKPPLFLIPVLPVEGPSASRRWEALSQERPCLEDAPKPTAHAGGVELREASARAPCACPPTRRSMRTRACESLVPFGRREAGFRRPRRAVHPDVHEATPNDERTTLGVRTDAELRSLHREPLGRLLQP
jgi:hypothetical protein